MEEKMKFLQELYNKAPQGVLILDANGIVTWANATVVEFLGGGGLEHNALEMLRQNNDKEIVWPPDTTNITHRYVKGELMEVVSVMIPDTDNYLITVNRLEGKNGIKTTIENSLHQMVAKIQHDLKTPLNGIIGFTDLAIDELVNLSTQANFTEKERETTHTLKHYLSLVMDMSHAAVRKINRFLLIEKLEQGIGQAIKRDINIISFIKSVMDRFYHDDKIKIHRHFIGEDSIVKVDPDLLEVALENMLLNAKEVIEGDDSLPKEIMLHFGVLNGVCVFRITNPGTISQENMKMTYSPHSKRLSRG